MTKQSIYSFLLFAILGCAFTQVVPPDPSIPMTIQTVTRVVNFTKNYSVEYFTHNFGGVPQVRFTLRLNNLNITKWKTQAKDGVWLGVGFGEVVMNKADIVHCQYSFSNNTNVDKFICNDRHASDYVLPPLDTTRNTVDVNTGFALKYIDGCFYANFEAVFDRPCNTGDS